MSRQVALGGVIGFLVTVLFMTVCQKNEPASQPPPQVQRVTPMPVDNRPKALPMPHRPPAAMLPHTLEPLNLEGFDAGRR